MGKLYSCYVGDIYMDYVALNTVDRGVLTTYFKPQDISHRENELIFRTQLLGHVDVYYYHHSHENRTTVLDECTR